MNPGGIRADLTYASSPKGEGNGVVTYEEAFTVQPFNNYLVSMTLTGAQIKTPARASSGAGVPTPGPPKILQVSKGFAYTYSSPRHRDARGGDAGRHAAGRHRRPTGS